MKRIQVKSLDDLGKVLMVIRHYHDENGDCMVTVGPIEKSRSVAQNKLSFLWYKEASEQLGEFDVDGYRAFCKLHFGVAIRKEKEEFMKVYDKHIKPLSYEQKIACMSEPINFPITSEMGVKDMYRYLEAVYVHFTGLGVLLSKPEDLYYLAMGVKK